MVSAMLIHAAQRHHGREAIHSIGLLPPAPHNKEQRESWRHVREGSDYIHHGNAAAARRAFKLRSLLSFLGHLPLSLPCLFIRVTRVPRMAVVALIANLYVAVLFIVTLLIILYYFVVFLASALAVVAAILPLFLCMFPLTVLGLLAVGEEDLGRVMTSLVILMPAFGDRGWLPPAFGALSEVYESFFTWLRQVSSGEK